MPIKNEIINLIENGKITKAIKICVEYIKVHSEDLHEEVLEIKESNKKNRADKTLEKISIETYTEHTSKLSERLIALYNKAREAENNFTDLEDFLIPQKIFISYNNSEAKIATNLKEMLTTAGASDIVTIENTNEEKVPEMISKQIAESDVTLSIISNKSLNSAWLSLETVNIFYSKKIEGKSLIILHLDSDFLDWRYQMNTSVNLSKRIKEIDEQMGEGLNLENDFLLLGNEKKRLLNLKNNLAFILENLKKTPIFDIKGDFLKSNMPRLVKNIKKK